MVSGSSSSSTLVGDEEFLDASDAQALELLLAEASSFDQSVPFLGEEVGANPDTFPPALMEQLQQWVASFVGARYVADTISRMQVVLSFLGGAGQCGVEAREIRLRAKSLCKKVLDTKPAMEGLLARKRKVNHELNLLKSQGASALAAAEARVNDIAKREQELLQEVQSLRNSALTLEESVRMMREEADKALAERGELSSLVEALKKEKEDLASRLSEEEKRASKAEQAASDLEEEKDDLHLRIILLKDAKVEAEKRAQEEAAECSELENRLAQAEEAAGEERAGFQYQISQLRQEIEDLKAELEGGDGEDEDGGGEGGSAP